MIQSRLFLLRDSNFIHGALSNLKLQNVFIHLELCYTPHESSFSKIHNRGTLNDIHQYCGILKIHIIRKMNRYTAQHYEELLHTSV